MKIIAAILILAAALSAAVAQPTNMPVRTLSLDDCVALALKQNFDIQYQRYAPQVSLYDLYAAYGSAYDPLLKVSGGHSYDKFGMNGIPPAINDEQDVNSSISGGSPWGMTYSLNETEGKLFGGNTTNPPSASGEVYAQVDQPLLKNFWIDDNRLTILKAKNTLKNSEQQLRLQLITSIAAVENAYYELIYARENLNVQQEALTLAQTQLDQDQQRLQIGTLTLLSVQQDESQVAQDQANVITAAGVLGTDEDTLKNLITDNYQEWHNVDIEPSGTLTAVKQPLDLQDSWGKGMTLRPDLLQARISVEQQGIQLKFDRNQVYPALDLTGTYGYSGNGLDNHSFYEQVTEANRPQYSYGVSLTVPLSNASARNAYKADKITEKQLLLQLKQLEQNVMVQIDNAVKTVRTDYESVEATRQARVYAEEALDAEQKTYAVGKATTFEVLTYQNNVTTARGQEIRALANYEEALSNLAQQEGSTLQRRNVDFEVK